MDSGSILLIVFTVWKLFADRMYTDSNTEITDFSKVNSKKVAHICHHQYVSLMIVYVLGWLDQVIKRLEKIVKWLKNRPRQKLEGCFAIIMCNVDVNNYLKKNIYPLNDLILILCVRAEGFGRDCSLKVIVLV